jgi:hypothetical protein
MRSTIQAMAEGAVRAAIDVFDSQALSFKNVPTPSGTLHECRMAEGVSIVVHATPVVGGECNVSVADSSNILLYFRKHPGHTTVTVRMLGRYITCPAEFQAWCRTLIDAANASGPNSFTMAPSPTRRRQAQSAFVQGSGPPAGKVARIDSIRQAGLNVGWNPGAKADARQYLASPFVKQELKRMGYDWAETGDGGHEELPGKDG